MIQSLFPKQQEDDYIEKKYQELIKIMFGNDPGLVPDEDIEKIKAVLRSILKENV